MSGSPEGVIVVTKTALITGVTGQDGAFLSRFLLDKGYEVFGAYRRLSTPNFWRLQHLGVMDRVHLIPMDLIDLSSIIDALKVSAPQEVYHLAAQSFVGTSFDQPISTGQITGLGVTYMLEAIKAINPNIRFYQASSSELFGNGLIYPQNESTPFQPASPYGAAKLYGHWITRIQREGYGMFACNGILFNHESPIRGLEFVTRKITNQVAKISLGLAKNLHLGNLDASRDWGYAPEYTEAMWMILQQKEPQDFVIATGETHTVREFVEEAFSIVGLDWEEYVIHDSNLLRPLEVGFLHGDASLARAELGWIPQTHFAELVRIMVEEDVKQWGRWQSGEPFAWDAPYYPNENQVLSRSIHLDR